MRIERNSFPFTTAAALAVSALFLSMSPSLYAQQEYGRIIGLVSDSSGSQVASAKITIRGENTGLTRGTVSNSEGQYELPGISPGTYTVEAELAGFKKFVNTGLIVYATRTRTLDIRLEVGEVAERVTVEGGGSVIETSTSTVTYTLPQKEVDAFRLGSWMVYRVAENPGADARSQVHGSYANNTVAQQDGVATNAYGTFRAPQELVQEMNQVSLNASAEYKTATTISGVARGGTNDLHAEAYIHVDNPRLRTLRAFETVRRPEKPSGFKNYMASGPVYIPRLYNGRNKTFWRFLYQPVTNRRTGIATGFVYPTEAIRRGDMNQVVSQQRVNLRDPVSGQPFPNNIIPANRLNPQAQAAFKYMPLPNFGPAGNLVDNVHGVSFNNTVESHTHIRIDHSVTRSNTATFTFYRYFRDLQEFNDFQPLQRPSDIDHTYMFSVQDTHTFSPHVVNEFLFGHNRQGWVAKFATVEGNSLLRELGITDLGGRTPPAGLTGAPRFFTQVWGFQPGALTGAFSPGEVTYPLFGSSIRPDNSRQDPSVWNLKDTISIHKGSHTIKAGVQMSWERPWTQALSLDSWGTYNFTGTFSGSDMGDFLLGLPFTTVIGTSRPPVYARGADWGAFVQDDWKVSPKLTLSLGVRFQHYGAPTEANGLFYNFDFEKSRVVVPDQAIDKVVPVWPKALIPVVKASEAGFPKNLVNFARIHIDPRFGIAYRLTSKTVLRAGYGVYHVPFAMAASSATGLDRAGWLGGREAGPFAGSESFGPNQIVNGVPTFSLARPFPAVGSGTIARQGVRGIPLNSRKDSWAYDQQWNLTLEKELPARWATRFSYVGTKGTNWPYRSNLQTPRPGPIPFNQRTDRFPWGEAFAFVDMHSLGGTGSYHGIEIEGTRQFAKGIYYRGWWEYRRVLTDVDPGLFSSTIGFEAEDPGDRRRDKGWQNGVSPVRWSSRVVWDVPVGRGMRFGGGLPGAMNHLLGNWTVAFIYNGSTHARFTPTYSGPDPSNTGRTSGRPDQTCDPNGFGSTPGRLWNPACFAVPQAGIGRFGTATRGVLWAPAAWTTALNVFKRWSLTGKESGPYLQVDMYADNAFNHRNASGPASTNITSANFGVFNTNGGETRFISFRARLGF